MIPSSNQVKILALPLSRETTHVRCLARAAAGPGFALAVGLLSTGGLVLRAGATPRTGPVPPSAETQFAAEINATAPGRLVVGVTPGLDEDVRRAELARPE